VSKGACRQEQGGVVILREECVDFWGSRGFFFFNFGVEVSGSNHSLLGMVRSGPFLGNWSFVYCGFLGFKGTSLWGFG